jgi:hypothetical protein
MFYFSFFLTAFVNAKQISFSKHSEGDHYNFKYKWLDHSDQQQTMNFSLSKTALFERFRILKPYQSEFSQKTIMRALKKQLNKEPLQKVQTLFLQENDKTVIKIKGEKEKDISRAYQQIKKIETKATNKYFEKNYYQYFSTHDGEQGIKMDHVRIANKSVADLKQMKSIILDKVVVKNLRKVTNYVLAFVQSIPYSTLESHITSSGAGFNPPAKLLWENQGDCDSKVTLTATILRALMPRIDMVIIYIDQHAFMGIDIPATAGEITLNYQGITYLLAEPTGPALYKLGQLAPESELAINQKRYVAEAFDSDGNNEL